MFVFGVSYAIASISLRLPALHRHGGRHLPARGRCSRAWPCSSPTRSGMTLVLLAPHRQPRHGPPGPAAAGCAAPCPSSPGRRALLLVVAGAYLAHYGWYERRVRAGDVGDGSPVVDLVTGWSDGDRRLGDRRRPEVARPAARPRARPRCSPPPSGSRTRRHQLVGRFAELLAHDGVEEDLELRSPFGFMAFHGGNLEEGTDLVAAAAAEQSGASLYAVRQPPALRWHIPSIEVDPDDSPALGRVPRPRRRGRRRPRLRPRGPVDDAAPRRRQPRPRRPPRRPPARARCPATRWSTTSTPSRATCAASTARNPVNRRRARRRAARAARRGRARARCPMWADLPADEPDPHTRSTSSPALAAAARTWPPATRAHGLRRTIRQPLGAAASRS